MVLRCFVYFMLTLISCLFTVCDILNRCELTPQIFLGHTSQIMGLYCQAGSKNSGAGTNSENLFSATGKNIKLWDLRQLQQPTTTQAVIEVSSIFKLYSDLKKM